MVCLLREVVTFDLPFGSVVQLDRTSDSGSEGCRFESCRGHTFSFFYRISLFNLPGIFFPDRPQRKLASVLMVTGMELVLHLQVFVVVPILASPLLMN